MHNKLICNSEIVHLIDVTFDNTSKYRLGSPHQPHPHQEDIRAEAEHVEDVEVNTTITDKIIDAQNSSIHSKYDMKPNNI